LHTTINRHLKAITIHTVATAIEKVNSWTLLGYFPGLFKQWRS